MSWKNAVTDFLETFLGERLARSEERLAVLGRDIERQSDWNDKFFEKVTAGLEALDRKYGGEIKELRKDLADKRDEITKLRAEMDGLKEMMKLAAQAGLRKRIG